ncbi:MULTISPECIES: TonB-dependent siderophore receptor [unclassified Pseudoalteromonas]|uniref:TonB-dependent siderophore receptor n=1 Tax=unclassified Pseudoalteromonas TaxID=194690 RepID=UPI0025B3F435|nr:MULTISPECIES: TonB-dependent siderophore receptor [unclassified Pseudoalteromonas]MDN3380501.1 TonB-dependent siderophore receptor [Pseudoalteromonas sp. APC 3893]MDN3388925.1 TonB-dependent siderophore receptor [Pseudoalteromonas sp. APC 4017]
MLHSVLKTPLSLTYCSVIGILFSTLSQSIAAKAHNDIEKLTVVGEKHSGYKVDSMNSATGLDLSHLKTPQSVVAVTSEFMADQQLTSTIDAITSVTGINAREADNGKFSISARGISVTSILYDGIATTYDTRFNYGDNLTDTAIYERVEIVRGATGLMLGAGNPSAAINLIRKRPTATQQINISASVGSWQNYRGVVDASSSLNNSETVRARAVIAYQDQHSYQDRFSQDKTTLYGIVEADLTDNTLLTVAIDNQKTTPKGTMSGGLPIFYSNGSRTNYDRETSTAPSWSSSTTNALNSFIRIDHDFNANWQLSASYIYGNNDLEYDVFWATGHPDAQTNIGMTPGSLNFIDAKRIQRTYEIELTGRFSWLEQSHQIMFGYNSQEQDFATPYFPGQEDAKIIGDFTAPNYDYPQPTWQTAAAYGSYGTTEQSALYFASQLNLTNSFSLILGSRLNQWQTDQDNFGSKHDYELDNELTNYLGATFSLADNWALYANYTDIFTPQSRVDKHGNYLDPIQGQNYEVGIKASLIDERLDIALSGFEIHQDNVGEYTGETIPDTLQAIYQPIDGTVTQGFEFELNGALNDEWDGYFGYTYSEGETPEGDILNTTNPKNQFKLFTTYKLNNIVEGLKIGAGYRWQSRSYDEVKNPVYGQVEVEQSSYGVASLMSSYQINSQMSVSVNIDNLFDKIYYNQIGFYNQYRYGSPRKFSLQFNYNL